MYGSNVHSKHFMRGSRPLEKTLKFYMGPTPILEKILMEFPKQLVWV
jgi:hypothetical protein